MRFEHDVGRYEFKYVLPVSRRAEILELVTPHVRPDPNARSLGDGTFGYEVHSLYLDTRELTDYFDRLERRRVRSRVRVRTYGKPGEHQPVFLENKRKSGTWVVKHRARLSDADAWCGCSEPQPWRELGGCTSAGEHYAALSFSQLAEIGGRVPVAVIHYQREVFLPLAGDSRHTRLTLDRLVQARVEPSVHDLFAPPDIVVIPPDWMIMELKFPGSEPGWMRTLCHRLGVTAVAVSKSSLSVAIGLRHDRPHELRMLTPYPLLKAGA